MKEECACNGMHEGQCKSQEVAMVKVSCDSCGMGKQLYFKFQPAEDPHSNGTYQIGPIYLEAENITPSAYARDEGEWPKRCFKCNVKALNREGQGKKTLTHEKTTNCADRGCVCREGKHLVECEIIGEEEKSYIVRFEDNGRLSQFRVTKDKVKKI